VQFGVYEEPHEVLTEDVIQTQLRTVEAVNHPTLIIPVIPSVLPLSQASTIPNTNAAHLPDL